MFVVEFTVPRNAVSYGQTEPSRTLRSLVDTYLNTLCAQSHGAVYARGARGLEFNDWTVRGFTGVTDPRYMNMLEELQKHFKACSLTLEVETYEMVHSNL